MSRTGRSQLTGTELLVLFAILGTLGGMLLPAFTAAAARSRQAICLANVKMIAQAMRM